jgi:hypothetical protein
VLVVWIMCAACFTCSHIGILRTLLNAKAKSLPDSEKLLSDRIVSMLFTDMVTRVAKTLVRGEMRRRFTTAANPSAPPVTDDLQTLASVSTDCDLLHSGRSDPLLMLFRNGSLAFHPLHVRLL